jgi:hypothetical protein
MTRLIFLCVVVTAMLLQAGTLSLAGVAYTYTCTASETGGAWNVASTWVNCTSGVPGANDTVLVSGPKAVVTIASGQTVSVIRLQVENAATLSSKGTTPASSSDVCVCVGGGKVKLTSLHRCTPSGLLNAVTISVNFAKLTSTGKVTLMSRLDDPYMFDAGLDVQESDLMLSADLVISGQQGKASPPPTPPPRW